MNRTFKTPKGTELPLMDIKGKPYLSIQHRIMWFREDYPDWTIESNIIHYNADETRFVACIRDPSGRMMASGHKREDKQGFADHFEKAESGAIGRALGFLGYGTAFALDLEEGQRLADAPTEEKKTQLNSHPQYSAKTTSNTSASQEPPAIPDEYVVNFGKYKGETIQSLVRTHGQPKINSYIQWLEVKAKEDKKPMSQDALNFKEAFDAFAGHSELDQALDKVPQRKETLEESLARLKNKFEPKNVQGRDQPEMEPWDPNESLPF